MATTSHYPLGRTAGLLGALLLVHLLGGAVRAADPEPALAAPDNATQAPLDSAAGPAESAAPASAAPPTASTGAAEPAAAGETSLAIAPEAAPSAEPNLDPTAPLPDDPRSQALVARVQALWAAKIKRDFAAVYEFETPEYRAQFSAEAFAKRFGGGVNWRGIEVIELRYDDERNATVGILLDYTHLHPFTDQEVRNQSLLREHWTEVSDQWYHQVPSREPLGDLTPVSPADGTGQTPAPQEHNQ